ncbi:MAG: malic enzyme-like NAD(P)-binding protein [Patescibacteria group bacterium]
MDYASESLKLHEQQRGKIALQSKVPLKTRTDLSLAYTPGVAEPCRRIAADRELVFKYTSRGNSVAVVTDGSAVLGLGNIGPEAALPVMEGKAILFKEFGGVDAFPICLATQDVDQIVATVKAIAPTFGGINLEDIAAPRCFEVEQRLRAELDIPVFHDDQHGTAIVVLAALTNAVKVTGRTLADARIVISGAGAAGTAIARMLLTAGISQILVCDRRGVITGERTDLNDAKRSLAAVTNPDQFSGTLAEALVGADVFIGVSAPGIVTADMVRQMNAQPIVFSLSNPDPEIMPEQAKEGGAAVIATGRSDYPNQVNNVLVFPGIFRGALDARAKDITPAMKLAAARALADYVSQPTAEAIIPDVLDRRVTEVVAAAVRSAAV